MEDEKLTQQAESSPAEDVQEENPAPSTEETQPSEATEQEAVEEKPFNEHPRFQELIAEKNELKESNARLQQQLYDLSNKALTPQQQKEEIEDHIYEANTPEEKRFWQTVEKIAESKAVRARTEAEKAYREEIKTYQNMVGNVLAKDFIKNHPDVKKNSEEMKSITQKAHKLSSMGMDISEALEDAYKSVMFDRAAQMAVEKERQKQKQKTQAKAEANLEQKSVSPNVLTKEEFKDIQDAFKKAETDLDFKW